jgi:hypothetical protein
MAKRTPMDGSDVGRQCTQQSSLFPEQPHNDDNVCSGPWVRSGEIVSPKSHQAVGFKNHHVERIGASALLITILFITDQ